MRRSAKREPVPWEFTPGERLSTWVWDTPHFQATIIAEGSSPNRSGLPALPGVNNPNPQATSGKRMYHWRIADKMRYPGKVVPLDSAAGISFEGCQEEVVETVAKAYPKDLGYSIYAGNLATTFSISKRRRYDFSQFVGKRLTILVYDDDNEETRARFKGVFDIDGYEFTIRDDEGDMVFINPYSVDDIHLEFGGKSGLDMLEAQASTSSRGTTFYEEWRPGCSGQKGYEPGTVTHSPADSYCFLHHV